MSELFPLDANDQSLSAHKIWILVFKVDIKGVRCGVMDKRKRIQLNANSIGKSMNPPILTPAVDWTTGQTGSYSLSWLPVYRKKKRELTAGISSA